MRDGFQDNGLPDASPIHELIRKTRLLLRSNWVLAGLGLTIGLLCTTLVVTALTDLAVPLWPSLRFLALLVVVVPVTWALVTGVVRPLFRRLTAGHVARQIESRIPGMHNRLVSCVDLDMNAHKSGHAALRSTAFYRRLVSEAVERIRGFDPRKVIDWLTMRKVGLFAGGSVLAFLIALALFSDRMPTALARILSPFADIPPATGVRFTVEPGDFQTLRGEDVPFTAIVEKGNPEALRLEVFADEDAFANKPAETLWYDLHEQPEGRWNFKLAGLQRSFSYRVHGGGTWSPKYRVTMLDRPQVLGVKTVLHYPDYMALTEPRTSPDATADVSGPIDSRVDVIVDVHGDAAEGEIQLLQQRTRTVEVADRPARVWFRDELPEGAKPEGTWEWDETLLGRKAHSDPANPALHSHGFHSAPVGFQVRPGEHLFADVYLLPDQVPEAIMLQWHDGQGWEHRAYWGADKIALGTTDTPTRRHLGPLPETARIVRLEVPAASVDLAGKQIHGIQFTQFGGKCLWLAAGTLPAPQKTVRELVVTESYPLAPSATVAAGSIDNGQLAIGDSQLETDRSPNRQSPIINRQSFNQWTGTFPLKQDGLYRVELRNILKAANPPMKEARIVAIPDDPPQVVLERPGTDLVLSEPGKVPLFVAAFDDFGLADLVISLAHGDSGGFAGRPVKRYPKPVRSDTAAITLDLAAEGIKVGESLRYRVEVRDRKGQSAQTKDYVIRIADDPNAADKQLANFDQAEDTFREKLVHLIAEQAKVQESVEKLAEKYAPLTEKVEAAKAKQASAPEGSPNVPNAPPQPQTQTPPQAAKPLELDPEATKLLNELRAELAEVAKQEEQNVQLSQQAAADLKKLAEQAPQLQILPPELAKQLQAVEQAFQQMAVQPLTDLNAMMKQGLQPQQNDPQLAQLEEKSDRVQQDLQALAERMQALAAAQKHSRDDIEQALADLQRELMKQDAGMTARDLANLKDFIEAMRKDLNVLMKQQEQMLEFTPKVPDPLLEDMQRRQQQLDQKTDQQLADARKLLNADDLRKLRRTPQFPKRPYDPESDEYLVPPAEEDTADPDADKADAEKQKDAEKDAADKEKENKEAAEEEDEPLWMPALGGPKPKLDPRFADKLRPVEKPAKKDDAGDAEKPDPRREELASRQMERVHELNLAEQSLGSDQQTLEQLLEQLQQSLPEGAESASEPAGSNPPQAANPPQSQPSGPALTPAEADALAQLMQSGRMRQAMAMLSRLAQLRNPQSQPAQPNQPNAPPQVAANSQSPLANLNPAAAASGAVLEAELAGLDLQTRTVILKMQPKLREELLKGLREEGPEGYQEFIRDYFRRLTKVNEK